MINPIKSFANSNIVQRHVDKCIKNPQFLTNTLLLTSVSKDVFAYALRVKNTLSNDEIPKDKKSFIAEMDATTGVITAVAQISSGLVISNKNVQNTICSKLFNSVKDNKKLYKSACAGFSAVSTLIGATLLAKRIVVPIVSTLITEKIEKKHKQQKSN